MALPMFEIDATSWGPERMWWSKTYLIELVTGLLVCAQVRMIGHLCFSVPCL